MKKYACVLVVALTSIISAWAIGPGTDVGGGGSVIILPDDQIVLADPYRLKPDSSELGLLSAELRSEIDRAGRILVRLGAAVTDSRPEPPIPIARKPVILSRSGQAHFITESVFSRLIEYRFVAALPFNCRDATDQWLTPSGAKLELVACTKGAGTWIRQDLFRKMTVREQAKLIIHERLHSLLDQPHEFIADLTSGLELMLNLVNEQMAGNRSRLSGREIDQIRLLMLRIEQLGLSKGRLEQEELHFLNHYRIWPEGGGLVHEDAKIAPDTFVGAGSLLTAGVTAGSGAEIVYSSCYFATCNFGSRTVILNSSFEPGFGEDFSIVPTVFQIGDGVRIRSSQLSGSVSQPSSGEDLAEIYERASLSNSSVSGFQNFKLASGAAINGAAISLVIDRGLELDLLFEENSSISRAIISPVIFGGPKLDVRKAKISFTANTSIDFEMETVCHPEQLLFIKGDLPVDSKNALRSVCAERFKR